MLRLKKAATYSPALPYLTRCTIGAWTVRWRRFSRPLKTKKPQRFLSKAFVKKKGGYLLSRIALFDTVYHQCMDSMVVAIFKTTQNEKDLRDFSPRSLIEKRRLPTLPHCPIEHGVPSAYGRYDTAAVFKTGYNEKDLRDFSPRSLIRKKAATYSPALHCSTIGASGLNFSVRNGKRWNPTAITT